MPTYDYLCKACGHEFELFQQMSDPLKRKSPKCGKPKLERLIGIGAGVLFKGGGFYETDYRSDSYTKAAEAEKKSAEAKPESAKPAEASAPTKTESKSEPGAAQAEKAAPSGDRGAKTSSRRAAAKTSASPKSVAKRSRKKR